MEIYHGEELTDRYDELIERAAADERILLSSEGKQAALVSLEDLAFLEEVDRKLDVEDAAEAMRRLADPAQASIPFTQHSTAADRS